MDDSHASLMSTKVFAVGHEGEIGHHVAPLFPKMPVVIAEPAEVLRRAQPGDLALFYSEHFDRFRDACLQLRDRQVATLYLMDGILEWRNAWENEPDELACPWTLRPAIAHKIGCLGPSQARILASWGNAEKVEIVGAPRLDHLWLDGLSGEENTSTSRSQGEPWRVLVATAKCPGFTTRQVETTYRSLKDIRDWFDAHPELRGRRIEVCWRLAADIAERLEVVNSATDWTGGELAVQLRHCDALITTPSTTTLEGMALRKPVALLDYHLAPQYAPAAWTISAREQIAEIMGELMAPPAVKVAYQQYLFRDALYQGEPATVRLERLIRQMAIVARQCAVAGKALRFAPQLLGPPSPVEESWDFCTFFPQIADISAFGVSESQREWGHARREIEHLKARIAQLQSELGEAHRIFESIHRHPVAGPIVRLRQKWLDWLQRLSVARTPATKASSEAKS